MERAGYEWNFGRSTFIPRQFKYHYDKYGRNLNISEYMSVKLNEIADMGPAGAQQLSEFATSYQHKYIKSPEDFGVDFRLSYKMPLAGVMGPAGSYVRAGMVQDIDAMQAKVNPLEWAKQLALSGTQVDAEHIGEYMYKTNTEASLMPGAGITSTVRKRTTLLNYVPLGQSTGTGDSLLSGVSAGPFSTPAMEANVENLIAGRTFGMAGGAQEVGAAKLRALHNRPGVPLLTQFAATERLQGGPFLVKREALAGIHALPQKEIFITPTEQMAISKAQSAYTDAAGQYDPRSAELLASGVDPRRSERIVEMLDAAKRGDILPPSYEKGGTRFIYSNRESLGGGSKMALGGAKGLIGTVRGDSNWSDIIGESLTQEQKAAIGSEGVRSIEAVAPILGDKSSLRHLHRVMEGATLFQTHERWTPDVATALQNAENIANVINEQVGASVARSKGRVISLIKPVQWSPAIVEGVVNRLTPLHRAMISANIMPSMGYGLAERTKVRSGRLAGITINDVIGLKLQGHQKLANLFTSELGRNKQASTIMDTLSFMVGRTSSIKGFSKAGVGDLQSLFGSTEVKKGALLGAMEGSALFDPAMGGNNYLLNLGQSVSVDVGGATRELTHLPLLGTEARGQVLEATGNTHATPLESSYLKLADAMRHGAPEELTSATQGVVNAMGGWGGKAGFLDRSLTRTKVRGLYGTLHFLSPEAESKLATRYGDAGGYIGLSMKQAKRIFRKHTERQIKDIINEGLYLPVKRYPEAPRGLAVGRAFLMDNSLKEFANMGADGIYMSPWMGAHLHGDLDKDMVTVFTQWAENAQKSPKLAEMLKMAYQRDLPRYEQFGAEVVNKLRENEVYSGYADRMKGMAAAPEQTLEQVAEAAQFKSEATGRFYVKAVKMYESALSLSKTGKAYSRFGGQYASDIAQVMFGMAEAGINVKRGESNIAQFSHVDAMFKNREVNNIMEVTREVVNAVHGNKYTGAKRRQLATDMNTVYNLASSQRGGGGYGAYRKAFTAKNITELDRAVNIPRPATGTVMGDMVESGILRAAKDIGAGNAKTAAAAAGEEGLGGAIGKIAGDFVEGLKQGKGWTTVAAGVGILGGIAYSMRRPGSITVVPGANEARSPDGSMVPMPSTRAPIIAPRRQSRPLVMSDSQYDIRVKIKDVKRRNRDQFVSLGQAISGKYQGSGRVNVNLKDDTKEIDYKRVYDNAYRQAMLHGS